MEKNRVEKAWCVRRKDERRAENEKGKEERDEIAVKMINKKKNKRK